MSYFGLDVFCQFEAKLPEFDVVFSVSDTSYQGKKLADNKEKVYEVNISC
jgi:hypothetical protein